MNKLDLSGVGVALVTPFQRNETKSVDYTALERLLEHCISNGVNYFVVNGTTAENPVLTVDEKQQGKIVGKYESIYVNAVESIQY